MIKHIWHGQTFWLHPHRLMYWEDQNILIGSDLHLGKTGHFRKAGIGIPQLVYKEDLQRLFAAIQHFKPKEMLIVGDLFHSEANKELDWFIKWRNDFAMVNFKLVKGNHDILHKDWYEKNGLALCADLQIDNLRFVHDPPVNFNELAFLPNISGHLHPGVSISNVSKQKLRLPCFYFTTNQCVLPAFSLFTGLFSIKSKIGEDIFAITPSNMAKGEMGMVIKI